MHLISWTCADARDLALGFLDATDLALAFMVALLTLALGRWYRNGKACS
jgi:hypothetical protein